MKGADILGRIHLGQADAVGRAGHYRRQVGQRKRVVERIDAHPEFLALAIRPRLEISTGHLARDLLALVRDRILQVEDQRIGGILTPLGQLAFAVAGYEEPRADDHAGLFIIKPVRTT